MQRRGWDYLIGTSSKIAYTHDCPLTPSLYITEFPLTKTSVGGGLREEMLWNICFKNNNNKERFPNSQKKNKSKIPVPTYLPATKHLSAAFALATKCCSLCSKSRFTTRLNGLYNVLNHKQDTHFGLVEVILDLQLVT